MNRNLIAACMLSIALSGVSNAQRFASSLGGAISSAQVKDMVREARAPEQYKVLAKYYGEQHASYLQRAAEEKKEWGRRSANITGIQAKYPRPVDSARALYEYYMLKASQTGCLESTYTHLASIDAPVTAQ